MWRKALQVLGWSNRQAIVFLAFLYLFIFLPLVLEERSLNNALLWLIGIMLLLYTVETYGLRVETLRQSEAAIEPLVIATLEERPKENETPLDSIVLRNLGRGPALRVLIDDIAIEKVMNGHLGITFEIIDYIESGTGKVAAVKRRDRGERGGPSQSRDWSSEPDLLEPNRTYNVTITYEDIYERPHQSVVQLGKGSVRLLKHGRTTSGFPR